MHYRGAGSHGLHAHLVTAGDGPLLLAPLDQEKDDGGNDDDHNDDDDDGCDCAALDLFLALAATLAGN